MADENVHDEFVEAEFEEMPEVESEEAPVPEETTATDEVPEPEAEEVPEAESEETPVTEEVPEADEAPEADEVPEAEEVPDPEESPEADETPDSEVDPRAEWQARHDRRVAGIASAFAAFVAKGEEILSGLDRKADEVDARYGDKAAAANERIDGFAAKMQARIEKAADQFARDLDVIMSAVNGAPVDGDPAAEAAAGEPEVATAPDAAAESEVVKSYEPQFTTAAKAMRERMQVDTVSDLMLTDPEFVERFANFAFDDVPADVDLPDRTRFMCWIATLLGCQGIDEFRALLPAALNVGVEPETVKEIVYQASAYLGIGRVYPFLKATNEVLVASGVELPLKSQATTEPTEESRYEGGETAQVACFGEHMHGYKDKGNPDYPWIAQWLVKNCFGDWYTRGGLTIPERELITFCFIAAQGGCENQLRAHTAGNVQCGNDREFLIKVVSNNVPFIGYPRTLNAMAIVDEVTGSKE